MRNIFATQKSSLAEVSLTREKHPYVWAFVCAIVITSLPRFVVLAKASIEVSDIVAGIKHSKNQLRDYELQYKVTKTWLYKSIYSQSEAKLGNKKTPPKLLRFERKTEDEIKKAMISQYTWRAKGSKYFYTRDFKDTINDLAHSEKHAFNLKRHLQFNNYNDVLTGIIDLPGSPYRATPTDVIGPENFFAEFQNRPIVDWLGEDSVTISSNMETVAGRPCYVIECTNEKQTPRVKFWISPHFGFRPMKMEYYRPNGEFCLYKVTEMKEVEERLWLPMKGTEQWYVHPPNSESLVLYSIAEFEVEPNSVKVNSGISDQEFTFTFPQGTQVHDRTINLMYVVGDGEYSAELVDHFLSASEKLAAAQLKLPGESRSKRLLDDVQSQFDEVEPDSPGVLSIPQTRRSGLWLAVLIALAGLIGVFVVYKKKRPHG